MARARGRDVSFNFNIRFTIWTLLWTSLFVDLCQGVAKYSDVTKLYDDKLGPNSGYSVNVRPVRNQLQITQVNLTFDIVAIVDIDAISQKFVVNGFLGMSWLDELLTWNISDYPYTYAIHPDPKQIWRPRLILTNTIDKRDLFEDDYCPVTVNYKGMVNWYPGHLFPTSCKLDLYKYPFDEQECYIELYSMYWSSYEITFHSAIGVVSTTHYVKSGEWEIENTTISTFDTGLPSFRMNFKLHRLPGFFIINIIIPIVLMSFLNILVFVIPVDSGEKISYGITVLLALTVFMSIVSEQLPRSSDTLPLVTIYLLVLTVLSVCTVIVSIFIVYFHHREEKEVTHQRATSGFKSIFHKFSIANRATKGFNQVNVKPANPERQISSDTTAVSVPDGKTPSSDRAKVGAIFNVFNDVKEKMNRCQDGPHVEPGDDEVYVNRWRLIGKNMDCISFVVFTIIWISVTIGFLVEIAR